MTMRQFVGSSANGKQVFVDPHASHAATHLADTPDLLRLVQEVLANNELQDKKVILEYNFGKNIGFSDLVTTTDDDEILYAKRLNRDTFTRFVKFREPQPTSYVTVILYQDKLEPETYDLHTAWVGTLAPAFPGDPLETPQSRIFWRDHALIWGNQEIQPGTQTILCPW